MNIGDVKPATDEDFKRLRQLVDHSDDWHLAYSKNPICVWTKNNNISSFNIIKIRSEYSDVSCNTLYDVLHDPHYRKVWDPTIIEGREICRLDANNDIGYYAMQLPKPLANRDFVTLRSWRDLGSEKLIVNHSVNHASAPVSKLYVRGVSYITGYLIRSTSGDPNLPGCTINYVTQSDPKGHLPSWVVNQATQWLAPKVVYKLHKASMNYNAWKKDHSPTHKPWLFPHQSSLPHIKSKDILILNGDDVDGATDDNDDEFNAKEEDVTMDGMIRQ